MKVHKKLAGKAYTIGDLKQFINHAETEGFTEDTLLNPEGDKPGGISVFLDETTGESEFDKPKFTHTASCPECRQRVGTMEDGIIPLHYRGDTTHESAKCYGVGKIGRNVGPRP